MSYLELFVKTKMGNMPHNVRYIDNSVFLTLYLERRRCSRLFQKHVVRPTFDINVCIAIKESIPLLVDY
jgi:hypothetical protein